MASEHDNRDNRDDQLRRRREARKAQADQRNKQRKARQEMMLRLAGVAVVVALVAGLIYWVGPNANRQDPNTPQQTALTQEGPENPTTQPEAPTSTGQEPTTVIHIAAAGDLNITDEVLKNAYDGSQYDFTSAFMDVAPILTAADLTLMNFEGTLAGEPFGGERSSAPQVLAEQLEKIGVDVVQTANSASIRAGLLGLQSTVDGFYQAGILPVGTFADRTIFKKTGGYSIMNVNGIKIALVGFTKGMDNLGLPEGSEDCVNVLYRDYTTDYQKVDSESINRVLENVAKEKPDLTIAMVHWGSENNEDISASQKKIRNLMIEGGVDIILGTHPHVVQSVAYDQEAGTLVAYSLGDFFGNAAQAGTAYSMVLDIEVTRDNTTGVTKVTGFDYTPIYTLKPEDSQEGGHRVVRLKEAIARYDNSHIGRVTDDVYQSMTRAVTRLDERIKKEVK